MNWWLDLLSLLINRLNLDLSLLINLDLSLLINLASLNPSQLLSPPFPSFTMAFSVNYVTTSVGESVI
jgi:hypothetical protein